MSPFDSYLPFLKAQKDLLLDDLTHQIDLLKSSKIPEEFSAVMKSRQQMQLEKLKEELLCVQERIIAQDYPAAWELLDQIRQNCQRCQVTTMAFLGGLAIRKVGIDRGMAEAAQSLLKGYAVSIGMDWSPVAIIGSGNDIFKNNSEAIVFAPDPADSLVQIPAPCWDFWHLPLTAQALGYWIAKNQPGSALQGFFDQEIQRVRRILTDAPPSLDEIAACLPEISAELEERLASKTLDDYMAQRQTRLEQLVIRQKVHLWQLAGDTFATLIVGPAYVYALLFYQVDPLNPLAEGETLEKTNSSRSRYLPCDARRLAVCLRTLQTINQVAKEDRNDPGRLSPDLKRLQKTWEAALMVSGNPDVYKLYETSTQTWADKLGHAWIEQYTNLAQKTVQDWDQAHTELEPILKAGSAHAIHYDLMKVINAGWWCRVRYPDLIDGLTQDGWKLLEGLKKLKGIGVNQQVKNEYTYALLSSRIYDLEAELITIHELFQSDRIPLIFRNNAAGRFYRLLSEQDGTLGNIKRSVLNVNPDGSAFGVLANFANGPKAQEIRLELLDFLGGIFMREEALDDKACTRADLLVKDIARQAGVNWNSAVIPGKHPLFSPSVEYIYLRFPDWDIWNLPLMIHELGHVTALTSPQFTNLLAEQQIEINRLPPGAISWTKGQIETYFQKCISHFHELFADGFAVYCMGPAYALCTILLNFDPRQAYDDRGDHPSHNERVHSMLKILDIMNIKAAEEENRTNPYAKAIMEMRGWWDNAVAGTGKTGNDLSKFHSLHASSLAENIIFPFLKRYFRLGIQYRAVNWDQAMNTANKLADTVCKKTPGSFIDLSLENLPDLVNIAWICRIRNPECTPNIASAIRKAFEAKGIYSSE